MNLIVKSPKVKRGKLKTMIKIFRPALLHFAQAYSSSSSTVSKFQRVQKDSESIAQTLRKHVGEHNVSFAEAIRSQHGQDEGPDKGEMPDVVVFAESTQHVSEVSCNFIFEWLIKKA